MSPGDDREAAAGMLAAQIRLLKNSTVGFIRYKQVVYEEGTGSSVLVGSNCIIVCLLWSDINVLHELKLMACSLCTTCSSLCNLLLDRSTLFACKVAFRVIM